MTTGAPLTGDYRDYSVFGLRVRSRVALPELFPAAGDEPPDVTIELGRVAEETPGGSEGLTHFNGTLLLRVPEVGRYRIEGGDRITVDCEPDVPERNVRLFLLGSAFGVLLHQRGLLPLHANAVEIDGRAVAFMGESGAGKSTLAAWFHDRGFRVIADDVCVVGFDAEGRPHAMPGLPRLRLWAEALEFMGRGTEGFARSYAGSDDEKYDVPIEAGSAAEGALPLAALYLLDRGDAFAVQPLRGVEAADGVFENTYRGAYLSAASGHLAHWRSAMQLVERVPLYRARRRWDSAAIDEQARQLLDHVRETVAGGSAGIASAG